MQTIDGRWLVDFGGVGHLNKSGKELILSEGGVTVAQTGALIGTYEVRDELLAITINLPTLAGESGEQGPSGRFNQLKLHGPLGLLLHHDSAIPDLVTGDDVTDPSLDHVSAAKLQRYVIGPT